MASGLSGWLALELQYSAAIETAETSRSGFCAVEPEEQHAHRGLGVNVVAAQLV
jgi:hypothetical protein